MTKLQGIIFVLVFTTSWTWFYWFIHYSEFSERLFRGLTSGNKTDRKKAEKKHMGFMAACFSVMALVGIACTLLS